MSESTMQAPPVSHERLQKIAENACQTALNSSTSYVHSETETWNTNIINSILSSLLESAPPTPQYKYAVNSTIIQHLDSPSSSATTQTPHPPSSLNPLPAIASSLGANEASGRDTETPVAGMGSDERSRGAGAGASASSKPEKGRRGMHSATGAYWNNETDGMWSWKFEGGEQKGMDVVVSVIWVAVA